MVWRYLLGDLHVHTVLSPCAEVEMIPPLIVERGRQLGLEIIGITDHNSSQNAGAVVEAASGTGLTVLPGMEVHTREEVHLVCLFDRLEDALAWQETVFAGLPDRENDEAFFGAQYVVDATGELQCSEQRMLSAATALSVEEVVDGVQALGGIVIAAHVDRPSFSLITNLGWAPPGLAVAGLEITRDANVAGVAARFPQTAGYGLLAGGDAHRLNELTARTMFKVRGPQVAELALALSGTDGRRVEILDEPGSVGRGSIRAADWRI